MTGSPRIDPGSLSERVAALELGPLLKAAQGMRLYLVGGAVRDLLLGRERSDIDVAVEGDAAALARRLGGEVREHGRFGTASVRLGDLEVDLASTRGESYAMPGALPEVRPAPLAEDLERRDFTVNAMAVPLDGEARLIDPHGGAADLAAGVLRVLHPGSFVDDPTRALRAARYAARFGFAPEPETERLLREADLSTVSLDRVEGELMKLAAEPDPARGFRLLGDWGAMELEPGSAGLAERVHSLARQPPWSEVTDPALAVHAAATGHAPGEAGRLRDLRGQARELAAVATPERPSEAVAVVRGRSGVELLLARAIGADWLDRYVEELRHVRLEISGEDLLAAGVPEGPAVGRGLDEALRRKLDGEASGREEELSAALEAAREEGTR